MKKGDMSTHALLSIVLFVVMLIIAIMFIYGRTYELTDIFQGYIDIPRAG